jgi:hypothetical protein
MSYAEAGDSTSDAGNSGFRSRNEKNLTRDFAQWSRRCVT